MRPIYGRIDMLIEEFNEVVKLDEEIDRLLEEMSGKSPESDEYVKIADQLTKLTKIKQIIAELKLKNWDTQVKKTETENTNRNKRTELELKEEELSWKRSESEDAFALKKRELDLKQKEAEKPDRVSKETLAVIAGNIAGIVLIIGYERVNVIASKALSFVLRSR